MRANHPNDTICLRNRGLTTEAGKFNGQVRLNYDFLDKPLKKKKPTTYAVWNDLLHEDVPFEFIEQAFCVMDEAYQHTFLILTKRIKRLAEFMDYYAGRCADYSVGQGWAPSPNVWLGVTVENKDHLWRVGELVKIPAAVHWMSAEPLLSELPLYGWTVSIPWAGGEKMGGRDYTPVLNQLDWVACGEESGPGARFAPAGAILNLKDQCVAAGVPFFLKQIRVDGKLIKMPVLDGRTWDDMPVVV